MRALAHITYMNASAVAEVRVAVVVVDDHSPPPVESPSVRCTASHIEQYTQYYHFKCAHAVSRRFDHIIKHIPNTNNKRDGAIGNRHANTHAHKHTHGGRPRSHIKGGPWLLLSGAHSGWMHHIAQLMRNDFACVVCWFSRRRALCSPMRTVRANSLVAALSAENDHHRARSISPVRASHV